MNVAKFHQASIRSPEYDADRDKYTTYPKQRFLPFLQDLLGQNRHLLLVLLHIGVSILIHTHIFIVVIHKLVRLEVQKLFIVLLQELVEFGVFLCELGELGQVLVSFVVVWKGKIGSDMQLVRATPMLTVIQIVD
jgi:hypothetical protein